MFPPRLFLKIPPCALEVHPALDDRKSLLLIWW